MVIFSKEHTLDQRELVSSVQSLMLRHIGGNNDTGCIGTLLGVG